MWYRTGTIYAANGSNTVNGTGTAWVANAAAGEALLAPDGRIYEIGSVVSDTQLTIIGSGGYLGATVTAPGSGYMIAPTQGYIRDLALQAATLFNAYAAVVSGVGAGKFSNGTLAQPGVRAAGDENTGLFWPAADTLSLVSAGVERLRIAADGKAGIGIVPGGLTVKTMAAGLDIGSATNNATVGLTLAVNDGANGRRAAFFLDDSAGVYGVDATATSGVPDFIVQLAGTEKVRVSISGIGIGSSNPAATLDLGDAAVGRGMGWGGPTGLNNYTNVWSSYGGAALVLATNMKGGTASDNYLSSYAGATTRRSAIRLNGFTDGGIDFFTDGAANVAVGTAVVPTHRMRITETGKVLIGTTTAGASKLTVADDSIQINNAKTPASAVAAGTQGQMAWDANFVYVCVATNTWKRAALAAW